MQVMRRALLLTSAAVLLAGCGVRGPLQNPKPEGSSAPAPSATAAAGSGQGNPENTAPKPHQGFILDGLLR
jgi:predicted small lipoprotein YifL